MQTALTIITAASLLLHTLLGCCSHGAAGPCACGHRAHSHVGGGDLHVHGDTQAHAGCGNAHDDRHEHGEPLHSAETSPEGNEVPDHPCHCHCDGSRCQAITAASAPVIELAGSSLAVLPPLAATSANCGEGARGRSGADTAFAIPALPVRAHLLYQTLLI